MRVLAAALLLVLAGCGDDDAPAAGHERGPFGGPATAPTPTAVTAGHARHDLDTLDREALHVVPPPTGTTSTTTTGSGSGPSAAPEERHYGDELAAAIGSPATCMDATLARTLHGRLSIQVSASVTPSGSVTRATVSGGSLPESVITCVQGRALAVHLVGPIEGAPRTISTTLAFDVETTDDTVTHETPVWHQPGAVAEPGHVLPAIGAEGRPEGSVEPSETLPARGGDHQDGRVAPDIVTPAQGGGGTIWPSTP